MNIFPYTPYIKLYDKVFSCLDLYDEHFSCMEANPVSGFTRLKLKPKKVCHGLISPRVNFYINRMMRKNNYCRNSHVGVKEIVPNF